MIVTVIGVKNIDAEHLREIQFPLELFENDKEIVRKGYYEDLCYNYAPDLLGKIVTISKRRLIV